LVIPKINSEARPLQRPSQIQAAERDVAFALNLLSVAYEEQVEVDEG
jgi:hypothetical protein